MLVIVKHYMLFCETLYVGSPTIISSAICWFAKHYMIAIVGHYLLGIVKHYAGCKHNLYVDLRATICWFAKHSMLVIVKHYILLKTLFVGHGKTLYDGMTNTISSVGYSKKHYISVIGVPYMLRKTLYDGYSPTLHVGYGRTLYVALQNTIRWVRQSIYQNAIS